MRLAFVEVKKDWGYLQTPIYGASLWVDTIMEVARCLTYHDDHSFAVERGHLSDKFFHSFRKELHWLLSAYRPEVYCTLGLNLIDINRLQTKMAVQTVNAQALEMEAFLPKTLMKAAKINSARDGRTE